MSQDVYQEEITRKKCSSCNFIFFTHYKDREICRCCNFKKEHPNQWSDK